MILEFGLCAAMVHARGQPAAAQPTQRARVVMAARLGGGTGPCVGRLHLTPYLTAKHDAGLMNPEFFELGFGDVGKLILPRELVGFAVLTTG